VYAVGRATGKTTPLTRLGSYAAVFNGTAHFLSPRLQLTTSRRLEHRVIVSPPY
jgi:hypothetical protein